MLNNTYFLQYEGKKTHSDVLSNTKKTKLHLLKNFHDEMTYTGDNITNITMEFNTPIAPMPLPQQEDKENILIKVEGNTTIANIAWKVRDLGSGNSPFTAGDSSTHPHNTQAVAAYTAMRIVQFFKDRFVPVTVGDRYRLTIGDELVMEGTLMKMSFNISGTSPVVWDGTNNSNAFVSTGVYVYRMMSNDFVKTQKMTLAK